MGLLRLLWWCRQPSAAQQRASERLPRASTSTQALAGWKSTRLTRPRWSCLQKLEHTQRAVMSAGDGLLPPPPHSCLTARRASARLPLRRRNRQLPAPAGCTCPRHNDGRRRAAAAAAAAHPLWFRRAAVQKGSPHAHPLHVGSLLLLAPPVLCCRRCWCHRHRLPPLHACCRCGGSSCTCMRCWF